MAHPERYFPNPLPDGTEQPFDAATVKRLLRNTFLNVQDVLMRPEGAGVSGDGVYVGRAGVAYACSHAAEAPALHDDCELVARLMEAAGHLTQGALRVAGLNFPRETAPSLLDGEAGLYAACALVNHAQWHWLMSPAAAAAAAAGGPQPSPPPSGGNYGADILSRSDPGGGLQNAEAEAEERARVTAANAHSTMEQCVQRYAALAPVAVSHELCDSDEFLYGRAGYLFGCLMLRRRLGAAATSALLTDDLVDSVARSIVSSGREMARVLRQRAPGAQLPPLYYQWPTRAGGEPYLGAAHGLVGILFVLLHCGRLLDSDPTVRDDVFESIAYVMGQECDVPDRPRQGGYFPVLMDLAGPRPPQPDSPPLVHWCHGPPGAVFLFAKAFKVRPDPSYLAVAERAAQLVWERGLLRKGWGLCHGISGNAYALLYLWRMLEECTAAAAGGPSTATGGNVEAAAAAAARPSPTAVVQAAVSGRAKWLHRARQFALFLQTPQGASVAAKPDNALSLFEGQAGALCLLADVLEAPAPTHARGFPFFQL